MPKIHWISAPTVTEDQRQANAVEIAALGLPMHEGSGRLAVVGGGPSIKEHIEELRAWDGSVWAVNGAINWCIDNGIDAWFYTADSSPLANWTYDLSRVRKACLAPDVSPELIEFLRRRQGAEITLTCPIESGPTSVNASDYISIKAGYRHVTYFGCEGSFSRESTHAFKSFPIEDWIDVDVGGDLYRTKAEFISQAIMLSNTISAFPTVFEEKSGGLLRAMLQHGHDYDEYQVSNSLYAKLTDAHGTDNVQRT